MPSRNVSLTEELNRYVEHSVQSGRYDSVSEVIRAAIRELKQSELEDKARVTSLKTAIQQGFDSGVYEGDVVAEMGTLIRQRVAENSRTRGRRRA